MEVILLEKVKNLGNLGDKVDVKPGYGRNFLIPTGKAASATVANLAAFEARRAELEKTQQDALAAAQARAAKLEALAVVAIPSKVGTEGKLFGSVSAPDIAKAVSAAGVELSKHEVRLSIGHGHIRHIGEYDVEVHLHTDVNTTVKIQVVAEA
jgi:large subunit ribosomal protein L9